MAQTAQQLRAKYALGEVQDRAQKFNKEEKKNFKSRASELPFMIHANGLGQALAFFKSKGKEHGYKELYDILNNWLIDANHPFHGKSDSLAGVTGSNRGIYMAAQAEAIMLMDWVKKFASAFMSDEDNNQNGNQEEVGGGQE